MTLKATTENVVGLTATKLTGAMPVLDASALTGISVGPQTGASDPTVSTNPSGVGIVYQNTTSGETFICSSATAGANVWLNVGTGSGDVANCFGGNGPGTIAGFASGGYLSGNTNVMETFSFSSSGDATDHGDLTNFARRECSAHSSKTHGYVAGGMGISGNIHGNSNVIQNFAFASASNATDTGTIQTAVQGAANCTSYTEGFLAGGYNAGHQTRIQKFSLSSSASVDNINDISFPRYTFGGASSITHGYVLGGHVEVAPNYSDIIDKFSFTHQIAILILEIYQKQDGPHMLNHPLHTHIVLVVILLVLLLLQIQLIESHLHLMVTQQITVI